jgi:hypothetical protein
MEFAHAAIGQLDVWSTFLFDEVSRGRRRARDRDRARARGLGLILGLLVIDAATDYKI